MIEILKRTRLISIKLLLNINTSTYHLVSSLAQKNEKDGLHPKHRLMNYHDFFLENVAEGDVVLDIGCGNGALSYDISLKAKKVTGIDKNKANISTARKKYRRANIEYINGDALTDLPDRKYDVIVLSNVLEHIDDRIGFLRMIKNLAPKLLIRVPMINRSWIDLYKKELGLEYRLDNTHYIEYTYDSFGRELEKAGLRVLKHEVQFGEIWSIVSV
jgi:2-polyprenyl-3-methyl-5-hydroxy-6-metoxy-1,4-benzoquinol methylase